METRSRKRVEATTHRPSTATPARAAKRARRSAAAGGAGGVSGGGGGAGASSGSGPPNPPPRSRPSTRTFTAASIGQTVGKGMETGAEAVPSGSRRDREKGARGREGFVHPVEKGGEEERGVAEKLEREMEKGKEKELERESDRVRGRSERAERDKAASAAASSGDEENDGEGGSNFNQNLASASSALHGLLRKLGAGLDDLMPLTAPSSHQSSKLKRILSGLRAEGEDDRQLEALSQLCELLSIGTEESLSSFSVDSFVPVLVGLLNCEYSPDIMLLAARALTHLCDVLPSSCAAVVHYGAVPCFCARLLTIEYIDLAEQSLQALEKISHEHPTACLRAGALMAVLSYLDFFSTGVQRVAVTTAANMCRQLPSDAADFVTDAVPLLTNLLQYQDSKVVEQASVCLSRIAETFGSSPEKLDMLCAHGLIPQVARLISVSNSSASLVPQASVSSSTYTGLIRLLSTCASGSAGAAESLLLLRISNILKDVLAGSGLISSTSGSGSSVNRPPEQLYEIVTLVNELLPALPDGQGFPLGSSSIGGSKGGRKYSGLTIASKTEEGGGGAALGPSAREILLRERPELLEQFSNDLFPVLVQVYGSSVNPPVRHKCLVAINKLVFFSTPEMLRLLLQELNISSFLAGVLGSKDMSLLMMALQIAEMLMQKLPDVFVKMFVKEGVVHALDTLIASEGAGAACAGAGWRSGELGVNAVVTASGGILPPARPRRGGASRRKSMGSADEAGLSASAAAGTVASPPSAEPLRTIRSGLRGSVIAQAKKIRETHFPGDAGTAGEGVTESLRKLKSLCAQLKGENGGIVAEGSKGKGKGKSRGGSGGTVSGALSEEEMGVVVGEVLAELGGGDGVSTFEFVGSGVVRSLIHYFSCGNTSKEKVDDAGLREQALKRLKQFIEVALPRESWKVGGEAPLAVLVRKLQDALASLERFPVVLSHAPRSSSGTASIAAGLSALTQPFKLRLCRATGDKMLRDYSTNIVLIEPLATLAAVEEFLWPRVKRQEASGAGASTSEASAPIAVPGAERRSTRSRSAVGGSGVGSGRSSESGGNASGGAILSGTKGKGKAVSRPVGSSPGGEDSRGPETRNAAARRRAAAAASAAAAAAAVSASGAAKGVSEGESEEDVEVSPVVLEEAVAMDEDDLSEEEDDDEDEDDDDDDDHDDVFGDDPVASCKGDRVHDVQLGDAEGGAVASSSEVSQPSETVSVVSRSGVLASGGAEASGIRTVGARGSLSYAAAALANARENGTRSCSRERKLLAAVAAANMPPKLVFSLGGKLLNRTLTIFQAIQRQAVAEEDEDERYAGLEHPSGGGRRLWDEVYTITYERVETSGEAGGCGNGKGGLASPSGKGCSSAIEGSWQQTSLVDSTLAGELPCDLDRANNTYEILVLLRVLEGLTRLAPRLRAQGAAEAFARGEADAVWESAAAGPVVPREEFLSSKLTPKLARQMQDALALCSGGLPSWCGQLTRACPFLFPFETRRQYFQSTAFGLSRALQRLQAQQSAEGAGGSGEHREVRVGRLQRQKVRVSRQRILESAAKVMELYAGHKAVLEVEYFGEVGTGLGPTLEFYTLLSHELQKERLEMWRTEMRGTSEEGLDLEMPEERAVACGGGGGGGEAEVASSSGSYVIAPQGLFPRPWHPETEVSGKYEKVLEHFRLLGRVMAKALQDGRLLDVPLSTAFYKIVLGQELDLYDIETLDPELGRSLFEMQALVRRKQFLEAGGQSVNGLRFRGSRVEDLCLDFTLPGYPEYELKSMGRDVMVELENLEEYITLVVDATVKGGIGAQMEAFRAGFNQVFQLSSLQIFSDDELEYLLCGRRELWAPESLPDIMKFDHGYTASSPPIRNLLDIMSELTPDEQRAFLRFVTGAPRLPPGGLAALNPRLTIVRKHPTGGTGTALGTTPPGVLAGMGTTLADRDLPSVMTCANYLKLPPYSCKEIMKERLMYAIHEGQGSFDLS